MAFEWIKDFWGGITPWTTEHERQEAKNRYKGDWDALSSQEQGDLVNRYGDWAIFGGTKGDSSLFYGSDEAAEEARVSQQEQETEDLMKAGAVTSRYIRNSIGAQAFSYNPNATKVYSSFLRDK